MPYGIIKVDTITFTDAGVDKSIQISGLVQNPTFSGNVTCTGTISGVTVTGTVGAFTTVSGITVTGTTANFTSGNFTNISGGTYTITSGVFAAGSAASPSISFTGDSNTGLYSPGADQVAISTNGTGRLFVDASGRVLVGTSSARTDFQGGAHSAVLQIEASSASAGNQGRFISQVLNGGATTIGPRYVFAKTRATSLGGATVVASGDELGGITFQGADGTNLIRAAEINAFVDGTPGTDDMPGRIVFSTTSDGSASPTERMRLDSSGRLGLGTSSPATLLHLSSATGSATPTPTEIRIATTTNAADWSLTDPWGRVSFYSSDVSDSGPKIVAAIDTVAAASSGGLAKLDFKLAEFSTGALTSRLTITPDSRVGIGTTSPSRILHVSGADGSSSIARFNGASYAVRFQSIAATGAYVDGTDATEGTYQPLHVGGSDLRLTTSGTERARIDSSGRLLVGTSSPRGNVDSPGGSTAPHAQIETASNTYNNGLSIINNSSSTFAPVLTLGATNGSSVGSNTIVSNGQYLGVVNIVGADGTNLIEAASIRGEVDGTPGTNDMPGRLVFSTTADGASSPTERMRIAQNGVVTIQNGAVAVIGTLTDAATITPDLAADCNFTVTLGGARTIANPTNITAGQSGSIFLVQDGTGGRTASWGSYWDFPGGTAPTLSTAANAVDRVDYIVRSSTSIHTVFTANYS